MPDQPDLTRRVPLGSFVHARSGDKGGDANLGLWVGQGAKRDARVAWLLDFVTPTRVHQLVPEAADLEVEVHPLPNLGGFGGGKICFGGNEVPEVRADKIESVWKLIFSTPFNGDQANNKCCSETKDVRRLLFALAQSDKKKFPAPELIETDMTVGQLWARIV